jgi:hypothetical protein
MPNSKVASAYVDLQLKLAQYKAAIGEATSESRKFSSQMREEMARSRESVRLLNEEIGLGIPRGLQKIIATSPAVASAMNLMFDGVIVFALLHTLVEVTDKVIEFAHKSEEAAAKHAALWEQAGRSMRNANDDLALTNDKLENAIAKLEHKPQNLMKEAIDDATVAADKLGEKLANDAKLITDVLKGNEPSLLNMFLGQESTGDVTEISRKRQFRLDEIDASGLPPEAKKAQSIQAEVEAYSAATTLLQTTLAQQGAASQFGIFSPDFAQKIDGLRAIITNTKAALGNVALTDQNTADTNKKDKLETALAAQKLADQQRLKQFQTVFDQQKAAWGMSVAQERAYWEEKLSAFKAGSDEYMSVLQKFTSASAALHSEFEKIRKEANAEDRKAPGSGFNIDFKPEQYDALNEAVARGAEQQAILAANLKETTAKIKEQTGQISPHQAAMEIAAAHTADYDAKLKALKARLDQLNTEQEVFTAFGQANPEIAAKQQGVQNQIFALSGQRQIQIITDQQIEKATTLRGGLDTLFDEFEARTEDVSKLISESLNQAINTVNDTIIKTLTTRNNRGDWAEAGKSIFQGVAKIGLETAEGGVMKALGLGGKLGASASNPMWVRAVGAAIGSVGSTISSAANTATSSTGGFFSGLFSGLGKFLGFMDAGGVMSPGGWYMTGETGPELINVGQTSRIYNARDTAGFMNNGGGDTHNWNIDARGATDPVAVRYQVMKGIRDAAPALIAASKGAGSDDARRVPASKRR